MCSSTRIVPCQAQLLESSLHKMGVQGNCLETPYLVGVWVVTLQLGQHDFESCKREEVVKRVCCLGFRRLLPKSCKEGILMSLHSPSRVLSQRLSARLPRQQAEYNPAIRTWQNQLTPENSLLERTGGSTIDCGARQGCPEVTISLTPAATRSGRLYRSACVQ